MSRRRPLAICIISWLLLLALMTIIFCMSNQVAHESENTSGGFIRAICKIFYPQLDTLSESEQYAIVESWQHFVRKAAHFSEYTLMGMLCFNALYCHTDRKRILLPLSWLIPTLYAASDEIHQLFIEGRSGQVSDVCLDSCGVLTGVVLIFLLTLIFAYIKNKRQSKTK